MKYKLEFWNYSQLNTAAWEKKLNERSCQGWRFRAKGVTPPQFALYERSDRRKRYTVDVYKSDAEGYAYEQDLESFVDFYRQLGWELVYKDRDGCYIFEAEAGTDPPPAYQSEEERRHQSRSHMRIGNDVYFLIYIPILMGFWAWSGVFSELPNIAVFVFVLLTPVLAGSVINIAYAKGRGSQQLVCAQDAQNRLSGSIVLIMLAWSLFWSVKMIATGGFGAAWGLAAGSLSFRFMLTMIPLAVPLFLLAQAVTLLAKKLALGDAFFLLALIAAVGVVLV